MAVLGEPVSLAGGEATGKLREQAMAAVRRRGARRGAREPGPPGSCESDPASAPARQLGERPGIGSRPAAPRGLLAARRAAGGAAAGGQAAGSRRSPPTAVACRGDAYSPRSWPPHRPAPPERWGSRAAATLLESGERAPGLEAAGAGRGAGRSAQAQARTRVGRGNLRGAGRVQPWFGGNQGKPTGSPDTRLNQLCYITLPLVLYLHESKITFKLNVHMTT